MVLAPILITLFIALLPAVVWLFFFLKEDAHPEPRALLLKAFIFGALASVPAYFIQYGLKEATGMYSFSEYSLLVVLLLAATEETVKWGAARSAVKKNPAFDEPVDAMMYVLVAGLGFATIENLFIAGSVMQSLGASGIASAGETLLLRLIGATLLHTLASALVGYYWARGIAAGKEKSYIILGIFIASAVHALFNLLVYTFQAINLLYPTLFLIAVSFSVLHNFETLKKGRS
jgi:RsiW-degrading membrane proteinase PrsW (M82 family)